MNASLLVLAGWFSLPFCMAGVAYLLEARRGLSDAQNSPPERRTAFG